MLECDFCGKPVRSKNQLTMIPVDRFEIPDINFTNFSWAWGACPECTPILKVGDWQGLLDRAVAHHPSGERVRFPLALVYEGLSKHQNGPLRGWLPEDDEDKET